MQRTCKQCGLTMPAHRAPNALFCSRRCRDRDGYLRHIEKRRAAARARYTKVPARATHCQQCGEPIVDRDPQTLYCSDLCKWRRAAKVRDPYYRGPRPCKWCGVDFTPAKGQRVNVAYCSEYCRNKRNAVDNAEQRALAKANWRHSRRSQFTGMAVTVEEWAELVEEWDGRCAYCGVTPMVLTQDHAVPIARGGEHSIDNIVPACQPCNSSKGDRMYYEWKLTPGYARARRWRVGI